MKIFAIHIADQDEEAVMTALAASGVKTIVIPTPGMAYTEEPGSALETAEQLYRTRMAELAPEGRAPIPWDQLPQSHKFRFASEYVIETSLRPGEPAQSLIAAMPPHEMGHFLK